MVKPDLEMSSTKRTQQFVELVIVHVFYTVLIVSGSFLKRLLALALLKVPKHQK